MAKQKTKKLLYVWKSPYPWDVRIEKICSSLGAFGWDVRILCPYKDEAEEFERTEFFSIQRIGKDDPEKYKLPVSMNKNWRKAIHKAVEEFEPDMIMPREIMLAEACADIGKEFIIPVVMDMAENYPAAMRGWKKYNSSFKDKLLVHTLKVPDKIEKKAMKKMDAVVVVCDEQTERLAEEYGFPREKTVVIHNTPVSSFEGYLENNSGTGRVVFGHHGYLTSEKSIVKFVEGFLMACESHGNIELVIAGTGEDLEEIEALKKDSPHGYRISLTGAYEFSEMPRIMGRIDVGVLPYPLNDFNQYTLHNKIFDFFQYGKPVLVSMNRPLVRVVKESMAGFYADCENPYAIAEAIGNIAGTDLADYKHNAKNAYIKKYNWELEQNKLVQYLERLIY